MKNNYKFLADEDLLMDFVSWLPSLEPNEKFYCGAFMRKKYVPELPNIKSDKQQLKRFLSTRELLRDKIKQLECAFGSYTYGQHEPVPQKALAVYITPNQRCMKKALVGMTKQCVDMLTGSANGFNIHQEAMSQVQKSASDNRPFICFDFDWKDPDKLEQLIRKVEGLCDVVETRGGYHMFVHRDKCDQIKDKKWYPYLSKYSDQQGDLMTPIVSCVQGNWVPHFIHRYG